MVLRQGQDLASIKVHAASLIHPHKVTQVTTKCGWVLWIWWYSINVWVHMYIVMTESHKFELVVASIIVVMPRATTLFGIVFYAFQRPLGRL